MAQVVYLGVAAQEAPAGDGEVGHGREKEAKAFMSRLLLRAGGTQSRWALLGDRTGLVLGVRELGHLSASRHLSLAEPASRTYSRRHF